MKVLVCGGRNYADEGAVYRTLDELRAEQHFTILIHGGAPGADAMASAWARERGVQEVICPANWDMWGHAAGPLRNNAMLELGPDLVVAFPGGRGTAHMSQAAERSSVRVMRAADQPPVVQE